VRALVAAGIAICDGMSMRTLAQTGPAPAPATTRPRSLTTALMATLCWALGLAVALSPLMARWGQAWLPQVQLQLEAMDDHYRTAELAIDLQHGEPKILWTVQQARSIVVGDKVAMPDARGVAQASTLLINLWGPPCLLWACLLGHMRLRRLADARGLLQLALTAVATTGLLSLDVPMVLWAAIWSLHASAMAPQDFSLLLWWANFLDGGGRWALACAGGMAICGPYSGKTPMLDAPPPASCP
jgi:hypothetical protein